MPRPPSRAVERALALHEQVEDAAAAARARCRCPCPDARSTTCSPSPRDVDVDAAARRACTSRRWSSRLANDLREARQVAVDRQRLRRTVAASSCVPRRLDQRRGSSRPRATPRRRGRPAPCCSSILPLRDAARRRAGRRPAASGASTWRSMIAARPRPASDRRRLAAHQVAARCGSAPADCAARARASPGTRSCVALALPPAPRRACARSGRG